jgi:plastocyanin
MTRIGFLFATSLLLAGLASAGAARADDGTSQTITIQNKAFTPAEVDVPAGQKIKLKIKNKDAEAAEFESAQLHREKVVPANGQVTMYVGPLEAGTYPFFNDFDPAKAKGKIVAK